MPLAAPMRHLRPTAWSPACSSAAFAPGLVIQGLRRRCAGDYKLIAFDMDSTLINIECVDEIADAAGRKAEVAAITEAAMRGEITDYKDSLRRRVALLAGVRSTRCSRSTTSACSSTPASRAFVRPARPPG
jgi:phosphoserine phosphatase